MRKPNLFIAIALMLGGTALAAAPAPETVQARQQAVLPDAALVLDGDPVAFFNTPAGAQLKAALIKQTRMDDKKQQIILPWLDEARHLTLSCRGKVSDRMADLTVRGLVEAEKPGFWSRTQLALAALNNEMNNDLPIQVNPDGKTMVISKGKETSLWLAEASDGNLGFTFRLDSKSRRGGGGTAIAAATPEPTGRSKAESLQALIKEHGQGQVTLAARCSYSVRLLIDKGLLKNRRYGDGTRLQDVLDLNWLLEMEQVVVSLEAGETLTVTATGIFPTDEEADAAAKALAKDLGILCGAIEQDVAAAADPQAIVPKPVIPAEVKTLVESAAMERKGKSLRLRLTIPAGLMKF